jgi:C-terminal processing protease CtpA/Prc
MASMEQLISGKKYNFYKILVIFILFFCFKSNLNAAWLGVQMDLLKDKSAIIITATAENSPANDAGLKPGDIILSADGKTISGDKQIQNFIKFLKNKPLNSSAIIIVEDKNRTKKNLTVNFDKKESPKFPIWTKESKEYTNFVLETLPVLPGSLINQKFFSSEIKSKYQAGTLSCVSKFSHAYSVGVKPYDQILSINGKKYEALKQVEIIEPGKNKVKIKR